MDVTPSGIFARALRTRWFVRAPIWLYRHGLGWLMGGRFVMIEHRGRTSGLRRYVCIEVVEQPSHDRLVVVSGFGETAQWYRNLRDHPNCFISTGRIKRKPATARFLTDDEGAAVLDRYQDLHPRDWRLLRSAIERAVGHSVESLPMVELRMAAHGR